MDPPAAVSEETNGNGTADQSVALNTSEAEETLVVPRDRKIVTKKLQLEDPANVPTNFNDYLNDTTGSESTPVLKNAPAIPTPVITPAVDAPTTASESEKEAQEEEASISLQPPTEQVPDDLLDGEQGKVTVADLVEKAEEEKESEIIKEDEKAEAEKNGVEGEEEEEVAAPVEAEEAPLTQDPKTKKTQAVKAAELAEDWEEEGEEEKGEEKAEKVEKVTEPEKTEEKSEKMAEADVDTTPVRKSGRAPKPTEKLLEGKQQEKMKPVEDEEESVDAIAAELEKSDPEVKRAGVKSPKKGPKKGPKKEGEKEEDWVSLIFGENGEKVTEKGKKVGEKEKEGEDKTESGELPDAEEFLMEQTQFFTKGKDGSAKKGGRPRKKDLDEKMDGVAKLGSNMYFYTGPGGATNDSPINSDDDEETVKVKEKNENARKSGRANKGKNSRLERADEVVEMPQAKAKEASLNPSWLKNHDGKKETPVKKGPPTPTKAAAATPTTTPKQRGRPKEDKVEKMEVETKEEEKEEVPQVATVAEKKPVPVDLPEEELKKLAGKTVKKGEDEYVIVVQGVETGLCGKYWGDLDNLPSRRRSKQPEQLQINPGKETPNSRRGSVGSVGSADLPGSAKKTPAGKAAKAVEPAATPKSGKKQVTKPEKRVEAMDSSQSESEEPEAKTGRGRKRKSEDTPASEKKAKKGKAKKGEEEEEPETTFSDYDSAGGSSEPLRKNKGKDSPAKESTTVSSKQQNAVSAALAAGVPAGQQRSVSCVADTSTQREVVVECFAPYDDHRWVNIGKERDQMAPDAVQYARALRPPYHLLSFLRIKGHSTKGMSCTDKNTMVFVVLEGEITVILHTTQFNAKKGDSFYIPPKNYYNLINQKAREAELSLIQFQYDGPLPTVQPTNSQ